MLSPFFSWLFRIFSVLGCLFVGGCWALYVGRCGGMSSRGFQVDVVMNKQLVARVIEGAGVM